VCVCVKEHNYSACVQALSLTLALFLSLSLSLSQSIQQLHNPLPWELDLLTVNVFTYHHASYLIPVGCVT